MRYTLRDEPLAVARIEADLATALTAVRQADPHLRSFMLTGGFARGEGATVNGVPQNDYDFVAIRGLGRPRTPYDVVRRALEHELGLHVDLAPIAEWRLPYAARSIFWYETALEGRVLWGRDLRNRMPVRTPQEIDAVEPMRLLTNRAAGLILAIRSSNPHEVRLQAAKAFLAALDATLLARGVFPSRQRQRHTMFLDLADDHPAKRHLRAAGQWIDWAMRFKLEPERAGHVDPSEAWTAAAQTVAETVPLALRHAGFRSLVEFSRHDSWIDRVVFFLRGARVPTANRLGAHPTARVRAATLLLLESSLDRKLRPQKAQQLLDGLASLGPDPLARLEGLRSATRQ
jgi:hypothetical protein